METGSETRVRWNTPGFSNFLIYRHPSRGDGHCLLHSVCNAIYISYRTGCLNGRRINRQRMMVDLRSEMAVMLGEITESGETFYESISEGGLAEMAKVVPELRLARLQSLFKSDRFLGEETKLVIEAILDKSIYILDSNTQDVYFTAEIPKERDSVVIIYDGGHFDMVSIRDTNHYVTHFKHTHPFIAFLRKRVIIHKS